MKKVLIIEDEQEMQDIYKSQLEKEGFEVIPALSGNQAVTLAKSVMPDIILLDIMLPTGHTNGFDVLEQLKKDVSLSSVPVIVMTNLDSERSVAFSIGASEYLVKANTSLDEVVATVKKYIH